MSPDGVLVCTVVGTLLGTPALYSTYTAQVTKVLGLGCLSVFLDMYLHLLLTRMMLMMLFFLLPFSFGCVVFVFTWEGRNDVSQST